MDIRYARNPAIILAILASGDPYRHATAVAPAIHQAQPVPNTIVDHGMFNEILMRCVKGERIDYRSLLLTPGAASSLDFYLDTISRAEVEALPRDDQLALYINLYNAAMIREVLRHGLDSWSPDADDFAVFKQPIVKVNGKTINLNDLENDIIRKQFKEPRVHAALVCAARSCPPLLNRAYVGADLAEVLQANMRHFINDPNRNTIDPAGKRLVLSKIFEWYADDFGGKGNLAEYIDEFTPMRTADYAISFRDYDWKLNIAD